MTNLERVNAKIFADDAAVEYVGQFGSALVGTKLNTTDVGIIQALPAYTEGWQEAVLTDKNYPPLPEMNGVMKTMSYQTAYILQKGIPEWNAETTYYIGDLCKNSEGTILYRSKIDSNIGNQLTDLESWEIFPLRPSHGTVFSINSGNVDSDGNSDLIVDLGDPFYYNDTTNQPYTDNVQQIGHWCQGYEDGKLCRSQTGGVFGYPLVNRVGQSLSTQGFGAFAWWYNNDGSGGPREPQSGQTTQVTHTFSTPLEAGTYKFRCASGYFNGNTFNQNNYKVYVTYGGTSKQITLPNLSLYEWRDTEEFVVPEGSTITQIKATCNSSSGNWGIGPIHLIKVVPNTDFENKLYFKVGGSYPILNATKADSKEFSISNLTTIDGDELEDGDYNIFISESDEAIILANNIYIQKGEPSSPNESDVWLDVSVKPYISKAYNGNSWISFDGVPLGKFNVSQGVINNVKTFAYNMNGWDEIINLPDYNRSTTLTSGTAYVASDNGWIFNGNNISRVIYKGQSFTPSASGYVFYLMKGGK